MRRRIEISLKKLFERKGYAVVGLSCSKYMLAGKRKSIYIILPKRTKRKRITIPMKEVRSLIDIGEKFFALPIIAVKFGRGKWVLKEVSKPERITVSVDEESSITLE